jgi:hypothetical protein
MLIFLEEKPISQEIGNMLGDKLLFLPTHIFILCGTIQNLGKRRPRRGFDDPMLVNCL